MYGTLFSFVKYSSLMNAALTSFCSLTLYSNLWDKSVKRQSDKSIALTLLIGLEREKDKIKTHNWQIMIFNWKTNKLGLENVINKSLHIAKIHLMSLRLNCREHSFNMCLMLTSVRTVIWGSSIYYSCSITLQTLAIKPTSVTPDGINSEIILHLQWLRQCNRLYPKF